MENSQKNESLELANKISSAIERSGKKKKDIATELGYSAQAVTGWEKTGRIQLSTLRDLGLLLGENLLGVNGLIDDLDPAIKQVIKIMQEIDDRGRSNIFTFSQDEMDRRVAHSKVTKQQISSSLSAINAIDKKINDD